MNGRKEGGRAEGRAKKVVGSLRVPNPGRFSKTLCEVERLRVTRFLLYPRNLSTWKQRENVFCF